MPINYAAQIKVLPADSLEEFVKDWLAQRIKDYHGYELWRGTGDMGRDVTGYADEHCMEGEWDFSVEINTRLIRSALCPCRNANR